MPPKHHAHSAYSAVAMKFPCCTDLALPTVNSKVSRFTHHNSMMNIRYNSIVKYALYLLCCGTSFSRQQCRGQSQTADLSMATKIAVVAGYGPGISASFSKRFGKEGFSLALVARTASKVEAAVAELKEEGITAKSYPTDLTDAAAVKATIAAVQRDLGPVAVLFWNPISTPAPLLTATPEQLQSAYNVTVTGLVAAVQAAHGDLKAQQGAVLVTGGGLALERDDMAAAAANWGMATLGVAKAAQRKLVHVMHKALAADGIYVAEVTVMGGVKGRFNAEAHATITPESVADDFWELYSRRNLDTWFVTRA